MTGGGRASISPPDDGGYRKRDDDDGAFIVDIDGFEGPLDVLLSLAREQKVDLKQLSIVRLADQYLAYIIAARRRNLELAAEYLVMAAWLTYLKSRLLLPDPPAPDEPSPAEMAAALRFQLLRLEAVRAAAARLLARPQLGRDFFARPGFLTPAAVVPVAYRGELRELLRAYADHLRRQRVVEPLRIEPSRLESVEEALARIRRLLGQAPGWETLTRYLPEGILDGVRQGSLPAKAALAATFAAGLQLAKEGLIALRQRRPFGPIYLRKLPGDGASG